MKQATKSPAKVVPGAANVSNMEADMKFKITEAYKTIRTNIQFTILKEGCKKIVISSSLPGEGKSTMSVNIAISLAQTSAKVLLIDSDLRRPKVHRFLNLPNAPGVTNLLGGLSSLQQVLHDTQYPNLKVICAGVSVPNPSELLASQQMLSWLEQLESMFDYIIIDSTPLNVVSDALPLIKNSDGVILVVRENKSTYPELEKSVKNLEMIDAKILGAIINGSIGSGKSGYTYTYNYS